MNAPARYDGVMISHVTEDLAEHREVLKDALRKERLLVISEDDDVPSPFDNPISASMKRVADSAAFLCLIGQKHGPIAEQSTGKSLTMLEFAEAQRLKRPILVFVMGEDHPVIASHMERDQALHNKLAAFKQLAVVGRNPIFFNSLDQFKDQVRHVVAKLRGFLEQSVGVTSSLSRGTSGPVVTGTGTQTVLTQMGNDETYSLEVEHMGDLNEPFKDTPHGLAQILNKRPVLWVGAGASVAAGYPTTLQLLNLMAEEDNELNIDQDFPLVARDYAEHMGKASLDRLLQKHLGKTAQPTELHTAIAELAKENCFYAVITTNYDDLLDRAFKNAGIHILIQVLDSNEHLHEGDGLRLLKIHGSYENWRDVILDEASYRDYQKRYAFLMQQLEIMLRQHPLLLVGCSLQDPRLLDWLDGASEETAELITWRPVIRAKAWQELAEFRWNGKSARKALIRGHVRPLVYGEHDELPKLFSAEVARRRGESANEEPSASAAVVTNTTSVEENRSSRNNHRMMLTNIERDRLVALLLKCPSFSDSDSRKEVIEELPSQIKGAIKHASRPDVLAHNIVKTCLNYEGGLQKLLERLDAYENSSIPMKAVVDYLEKVNEQKDYSFKA